MFWNPPTLSLPHKGGGDDWTSLWSPAVLALSSERAGAILHVCLARQRVVGDGQLGLAQALDLVAQAGGGLELQVGGGLEHLLLQAGDHRLDVVADERCAFLGEAGVDRDVVLLVDAGEYVGDGLAHALRGDAVGLVPGLLLLAPALGLGDGALQRAGHLVGVEQHAAVEVAGGAADGLDQRGLAPEEALLVGVEDGDQGALGDVEALAQQVDADQHVEGAQAQIADDLDALQGLDVGVHVAHADALLVHILGQVLGHAFGQHCDQRAVALARHLAHLVDEVVHLGAGRAHFGDRIDEASGADHLLGEGAAGLLQLPAAGRGRDVRGLRPHGVPLLEAQRAVVHAGGQAEAVLGEGGLAPVVAAEHAADLRHRDVALVDEHQRVVGEILEQRRRRLAGIAARKIARVVLDAGAGAGRLHHLHVEDGALLQALRLQQAAGVVKLLKALLQLLLHRLDGLLQRRLGRHVMRVGVDLHQLQLVALGAGERVELGDALDLVAEQRDAPGAVLQVGREQLHGVAANAEGAAREVLIAAAVVQRHQVGQQLALGDGLAHLHGEGHGRVGLDRADAVDARHARHDDRVVALQEGARGGVAHTVDLLVHRRLLLDVGVGARHVGFWLVVVVVGDEVLDRVVGEEAFELAVELRRQSLIGRENQGRALGAVDHLRHGEGLARACDAEQHLVVLVGIHARHQLVDGARLVAPGLVLRDDPEGDAAFRLLRPLRPVRRELRQAARHQRVGRNHRLLRQHLLGPLAALVRLGQQRVQRRRHVVDAARGRPGAAEGGECRLRPSPGVVRGFPSPLWGGVRGGGSPDLRCSGVPPPCPSPTS